MVISALCFEASVDLSLENIYIRLHAMDSSDLFALLIKIFGGHRSKSFL